jgi:hypothetical protein
MKRFTALLAAAFVGTAAAQSFARGPNGDQTATVSNNILWNEKERRHCHLDVCSVYIE